MEAGEQGSERSGDRERQQQAVLAIEHELDDEGAGRDQRGERDAPGAGARRGLGVGDHVEGEDEERAATQLAQRDPEWIAEVERAAEEEPCPAGEKGGGDVEARRSRHHEAAGSGHQQPEVRRAAPLAGRHPAEAEHERHHDREVGGIEEVAIARAQRELAPDRDRGGGDHRRHVIGAEQETERQARDQRAPRVERAVRGARVKRAEGVVSTTPGARPMVKSLAGPLREQSGAQRRGDTPRGQAEAETCLAPNQERCQHDALIDAGIDRGSWMHLDPLDTPGGR